MNLLDTNALLWLSGGSSRLGDAARDRLDKAVEDEIAFSAISIWETAILVRRGRYALGQAVEAWREDLFKAGLVECPVDGEAAARAVRLDLPHQDPADRIILATAILRGAVLLTSDRVLLAWVRSQGEGGAGLAALEARL